MPNVPSQSSLTHADSSAPPLALVVEDIADVREWLGTVLQEAFPGMEVARVGSLAAARAWLSSASGELLRRTRLALVDLGLPDGSGISLIAELSERHPAIVPIVATIYDDDTHLFESIAAGAQGYLLKDQEASVLISYLHRIDRGEPPLSPSMARRMMSHFRQHPVKQDKPAGTEDALTPREMEVLALLGVGSRVPEVAYRLGLSEHTVASYVKGIYKKLRISSRAEAALEAARRGLV